jgi:hypothetical protein
MPVQFSRKDLITVTLEGVRYFVGYKVVTDDMKSLGLRKNSNIVQFPVNKWVNLPPEQIVPGKGDYGGIWLAVSLGNARGLQRYMFNKREQETRIFEAIVDNLLYFNSYRMKVGGIKLLEEL